MTPAIPLTLYDLIAQIESHNNRYAIRFEPHVYEVSRDIVHNNIADIIIAVHKNKIGTCTRATAINIYSTSWGATQIMGFNLYNAGVCGLRSTIIEYLNNEDMQRDCFYRFLKTNRLAEYSIDELSSSQKSREYFGKIYNGDGVAYGKLIAEVLQIKT